jgi:soluble lytic murein transglycosylase
MPTTAREVARRIGLRYSSGRLHDPSFNVHVGAAYFRQVLSMFDDRLDLALAGYNGGPYRIQRLWRRAGHRDVDRFLEGLELAESRIYVKRILVLSDSYRQLYGPAGRTRVAAAGPAPAAAAVGR